MQPRASPKRRPLLRNTTKRQPIIFFAGLCDQTVDFIKKCAYNRKLDYYEAELVLKYWEYYDKPDFPFDLKPCSWDTLVSLLQNLGRYDVVDLLQDRRQQRPWWRHEKETPLHYWPIMYWPLTKAQ